MIIRKIILILIVVLTLGTAFGQVGVLNVGNAIIQPAPLDAVEDNGQGTFTFDIFEFSSLSVPVAGSPALVTISLSNIDVIDGINSVHGYETYFNIQIQYVAGVPNIYLQQKLEIPGDEYIPITIDIKVTANTDISNPNNGGNVNLTPGTGQPEGVDYTDVYTYTNDPTVPVELSSFTAAATLEGVALEWTTESEIENLGFAIDRKTADTEWVEIINYKIAEEITGKGSTSTQSDYSYLDRLVKANTTYEYRLSDIDFNNVVTYHATRTVTVEMAPVASVEEFTVLPAYPNPFNPTTTIRYGLDTDSKVNIQIYDMLGKLTTTLVNTEKPQGWHSVTWNGTNQRGERVPAGIYISRVISGSKVKTTKLMLMK